MKASKSNLTSTCSASTSPSSSAPSSQVGPSVELSLFRRDQPQRGEFKTRQSEQVDPSCRRSLHTKSWHNRNAQSQSQLLFNLSKLAECPYGNHHNRFIFDSRSQSKSEIQRRQFLRYWRLDSALRRRKHVQHLHELTLSQKTLAQI